MRDPARERFEALFGPEFGHGKPFDLSTLRAALNALGNPHEKLPPVIHVAGTNGKGSTIAFMRAIAEAAGLRAHAFTKPELFRLNERFVVAGEAVSDDALIQAAERVAAVDRGITQFDAQVAAAFDLFSGTPADLVLLETGMGGRDDSTNVIEQPAASVITPIALDHQDALGAALAEIAEHKAGILKPGVPGIVARQHSAARAVIEARAADICAPLFRCGIEWDAYAENGRLVVQTSGRLMEFWLPHARMSGTHQVDNAGLAVASMLAASFLPAELSRQVERAPSNAWLYSQGRLQPLISGSIVKRIREVDGQVFVDGGHNAHAAAALARWFTEPSQGGQPAAQMLMNRRGFPGSRIAIVGLRDRKDADAFFRELAGAVDHIFTVPLSEAHIPPTELTARARKLGLDATPALSLAAAMQNAAQFPAPRVLICGSFVLAAEALAAESA